MADVLREGDCLRTTADVVADLKREAMSVGDTAPHLTLKLSIEDFHLIRGLGDRCSLVQQEPWMIALLRMNVDLDRNYHGRPRIMGVVAGSSGPVDVRSEHDRRADLLKKYRWRIADARLRQGIDGRPIG